MVTVEDPRLTQIRALCDSVEAAQDSLKQTPMVFTSRIRAILDAPPVAVTPPQGIDRDALIADAIRMLYEHSPSVDHEYDREEAEELVDRMLLHGSYLTAAPGRDIIAAAIQTDFDVRNSAALRVADRILALVRPVEGVVLTSEEARTVIEGITLAAEVTRRWQHLIATPLSAVMTKMQDDLDALAARLEAAQ